MQLFQLVECGHNKKKIKISSRNKKQKYLFKFLGGCVAIIKIIKLLIVSATVDKASRIQLNHH